MVAYCGPINVGDESLEFLDEEEIYITYIASYHDELEEVGDCCPTVNTPDPNMQAKVLQKSTKFRRFFDELGLSSNVGLEIT